MQEFWIRVVSTMMIIGILFGYNQKLEERSKDEEIARLNAMVTVNENGKASEASYKDGIYQGEADGFGGRISVEVVIEHSEIVKINILSADGEDRTYLTMAETMIPNIIEKQTAEVDTVSGATFSSTGIKEAVGEALKKAAE